MVELLAGVNGELFRLRAENVSTSRRFGEKLLNVTGRGRNSELAAPYSKIMTFDNSLNFFLASQLADKVLTDNGVPIGWATDFQLTDWIVPQGAFLMRGTYIEGVQSIAEAAGGYLMPHRTDKTLILKHKYPLPPWEWDTMAIDIDMPPDPVEVEGIEFVSKPVYNRVYVSGTDVGGRTGKVTRASTAGDLVAPMVVDPLMTAIEATEQRGKAELSDIGEQAIVSLRFPVLVETGIVDPGKLIRYYDGTVYRRGLTRGVQVNATQEEVWQTVRIETHV